MRHAKSPHNNIYIKFAYCECRYWLNLNVSQKAVVPLLQFKVASSWQVSLHLLHHSCHFAVIKILTV